MFSGIIKNNNNQEGHQALPKIKKDRQMKKLQITEKEFTVLQAIAQNIMGNACGDMPECADEAGTLLWTLSDDFYVQLLDGQNMPQGKVLSGVISSLTKKGLIETGEGDPTWIPFHESIGIHHTEKGFNAWKSEFDKRKTN